ncbi:MAG: hypothetical protein AAB786_01485 [Patescibacteria group bacterium]
MKFRLLSLYLVVILSVFGIIFSFSLNKIRAASSSSVLVNIAPENPAPHEDVTIDLSSYANNLDSVSILWSLNGRNVLSGIGKKSFSLTAPAAGEEAIITANISFPDGNLEKRIIIRPSVMVLLSQATDSFVPPFYRGKAMPTADSEIKIVAMPEISALGSPESLRRSLVDPKNMTYAWKKDYTNNQEASGYGKNFFIYTNDYLEDSNTVSVVASTVDQKYSSEANIEVGVAEPKIVFYKNDNALGTIWERALSDSYRMENADMIVEAAPYFISPKELLHPYLIWTWSINDTAVPVPDFKKNFMPLRIQSGTSGTAKLRLVIENMDKIFQTMSKEVNIEF